MEKKDVVIGKEAVYTSVYGEKETGIIKDFNEVFIFMQFYSEPRPRPIAYEYVSYKNAVIHQIENRS